MIRISRIPILMLLLTLAATPAARAADQTDAAEAFAELVETLADPAMEGRGAGTVGLEKARDLLVRELEAAGVAPAFLDDAGEPTYLQPFRVHLGTGATRQSLELVRDDGVTTLEPGTGGDFNALGFSASAAFEGTPVFVGYGITAPERGYDSYAGLGPEALQGKVAIAYRYEPMDDRGRSLWAGAGEGPWTEASHLGKKAQWAAEHGAEALLIVDPPAAESNALRSTTGTDFGERAAIPVMHLRLSALQRLLDAAGRDGMRAIHTYQARANEGAREPDVLEGVTLRGEVALDRREAILHNVGGLIPGAGDLADEAVVVGAHYDHVGYGEIGSLAPPAERDAIHPGADDNASGTAALLLNAAELPRRLEGVSPRRAVVLVGFSGEERGLLGSSHLLEHPETLRVPLEGVVAMVNYDMVGRLRDDRLFVFGTESSPAWMPLLEAVSAGSALTVNTSALALGMSDHAGFLFRGIPAVHLFTGVHEHYHRPGDTADTINAAGGAKVAALGADLVARLATRPDRPAFEHAPMAHPSTGGGHGIGREGGPLLGVLPDYASIEGEGGAAIAGVSPGGPAAEAGLEPGDVITAWNGEPVGNVRDLTARIGGSEPGEEVTLRVERGGETIERVVILGRR